MTERTASSTACSKQNPAGLTSHIWALECAHDCFVLGMDRSFVTWLGSGLWLLRFVCTYIKTAVQWLTVWNMANMIHAFSCMCVLLYTTVLLYSTTTSTHNGRSLILVSPHVISDQHIQWEVAELSTFAWGLFVQLGERCGKTRVSLPWEQDQGRSVRHNLDSKLKFD